LVEKPAAPWAIAVTSDPSTVRITLSGDGNQHAVRELRDGLASVHLQALVDKTEAVIVDISKVDFLSTGCVRELLGWVTTVVGVAPPARYQIRFLYHPGIPWQKRSLFAFQHLGDGLVAVEPV
jgi:hypothetical protein